MSSALLGTILSGRRISGHQEAVRDGPLTGLNRKSYRAVWLPLVLEGQWLARQDGALELRRRHFPAQSVGLEDV